nr:forkhead box protein O-like [Penaeus vannamei]
MGVSWWPWKWPASTPPTPASLLGMDTPLSASQGPPGIGMPKGDAFLLKDLENGLRNIFPAISSVSTMNTLNTVNTLNSLSGAANNPTSQNNPLTSFLNMAHHHQQQQQQHQHQQHQHQQQQQHPSQHSLLHQLTMSSLANSHKAWSNSGAPDLTVLDPAIVSSGQLTDSRSDSPPHWMKTMEQLTEGAPIHSGKLAALQPDVRWSAIRVGSSHRPSGYRGSHTALRSTHVAPNLPTTRFQQYLSSTPPQAA